MKFPLRGGQAECALLTSGSVWYTQRYTYPHHVMQLNDHDVTNQEILEAMNQFATTVQGNFTKIDERFEGIESNIKDMKRTMTTLVTMDYLDEKLADLRGDMVVLTRKEDSKLRELVNILREKNLLNDQDVKRLITMEPFPQLMV